MNHIGVDVGGTKIEVGKVQNNKIIRLLRTKTDSKCSQSKVISQITDLIDILIDKETKSIGIAVPAIVKNGVVFETFNIRSWKKVPLKAILEKKYKIPVFIENDAKCFALGEKHFGVGKNYSNFVALTLGTGMGAGIILNDKLYVGNNCGAGEFGHVIYKNHDFEYYCSGKFFLNEHNISGEYLFNKPDKHALAIFNEFGKHLGKALAMIVYSLDPELIILGGAVSKSFKYFEKSMKQSLKESVFKISYKNLKIKVSTLNNPVLLGAVGLYEPELRSEYKNKLIKIISEKHINYKKI